VIKDISKKQTVLLFGDIILIAISIYLAPVLRFQMLLDPLTVLSPSDIVTIIVYILVLYFSDLYTFSNESSKPRMVFEAILAVMIINVINAAIFYLFHIPSYGSWIYLISALLALFFVVLLRFAFIHLSSISANPTRVLILGAGMSGRTMYSAIKRNNNYQVVGFVDDDESKQGLIIDDLPILGKYNDLSELINKYKINKIIVAICGDINASVFDDLVKAKFAGVKIYEMPNFYEKIAAKIPVNHTSNRWIGYADICGIEKNSYNTKMKSILDKVIALIYLMIGLPLLILVAVAIKIDSPGTIFYVQKRIGLSGNPFNIIKFRSMHVDSNNNLEFAYQKKDPRITRVGKLMRYFRIDEIPQLWNILRGEMSFIGPRALIEDEVSNFSPKIPYFTLRHSIRPGITGWAQINYRHGATLEDGLAKLEYDLYYIKNKSFLLDARIVLKTVWIVLLGVGAK
jgi:exopolysaccharide biosynthesis polyprenyl glycosylphosphotransferase